MWIFCNVLKYKDRRNLFLRIIDNINEWGMIISAIAYSEVEILKGLIESGFLKAVISSLF